MGVALFLPWLGATEDVRRRSLPDRVNRTDLSGVGDSGSVPVGPEFLGTTSCPPKSFSPVCPKSLDGS